MTNPNNQGNSQQAGNQQNLNEAHAPYNFVPLPSQPITQHSALPDHDHYADDLRSGYFDVTLKPETPLYIRGMLTEKEASARETNKEADKNKDKAYFFQYGSKPVIPGSSLRGMLRTLVEIVTFGKIQPVSDKQLVYRAVGDTSSLGSLYREQFLGARRPVRPAGSLYSYPANALKGGYLKQAINGWEIQPAKSVNEETFVFVETPRLTDAGIPTTPQTTQQIWVVATTSRTRHQTTNSPQDRPIYLEIALSDRVSRSPDTGLEAATLVVSGDITNRRWHPAIFEADTTVPTIPVSPEMWRTYEEDRDAQRGIPTRPLKNSGEPLFYLLDNEGKLIFFGPTLMFRLPYPNRIKNIVGNNNDTSHYDFAEAMFGYVGKGESKSTQGDKLRAYASRISVGDARVTTTLNDYYENELTPKILSGPKPTSFQLYLQQPNGKNTPRSNLHHYGTHSSGNSPKIRGYKLYWRQQGINVDQVEETQTVTENDTQHTRMKPLKTEAEFKFRVYFDNLSDIELGALAWALVLPGSEQNRHQLGMGKPLGMGVVKLTPKLYLIKRQERYKKLFGNNDWETAIQEEPNINIKDFITKFEQYMCKAVGHQGQFKDIERICQLLTMLELQPAANKNSFVYMQIDKQKDKYRNRLVLPKPSEVVGRECAAINPAPTARPQQQTGVVNQSSSAAPGGQPGIQPNRQDTIPTKLAYSTKENTINPTKSDSAESILEKKVKAWVESKSDKGTLKQEFSKFIIYWKKLRDFDPLKAELAVLLLEKIYGSDLYLDNTGVVKDNLQDIKRLAKKKK